MILGIQRRQWLLLLLALLGPLLLNAVAILQDGNLDTIVKMINGTYPAPMIGFLGGPYNPLPEISLNLFLFASGLSSLIWLTAFLSNKQFFQKQPTIAKVCETLLMTFLIAAIFTFISSDVMPIIWLTAFHDYLLGIPASNFTGKWSLWLIFPSTAILTWMTVYFSNTKGLSYEKKSQTP